MSITSYFTYLLPAIVLFLTSSLLVNPYFDVFSTYIYLFRFEPVETQLVLLSLLFTGLGILVLFYIAKFIVIYVNANLMLYLSSVLIAATFLIIKIFIEKDSLDFSILVGPLFDGLFIYWSILLLRNRNMAQLSNSSITYKNLLRQYGEIPLHSITMIEQKRHLLSVFREFKFIDWIKRTDITYQDENLDEFEISIYPRIMQGENYTFNRIVEEARNSGNAKIRQYVS